MSASPPTGPVPGRAPETAGPAGAAPPALERAPVPWFWWDAVVAYLFSVLLSVLAFTGIGVLLPATGSASATVVRNLSLALSSPVLLLATVAWVAARGQRTGLRALVGWRRPGWRDALAGIAHGFAAFVGLNLVLGFIIESVADAFGIELPPVQKEIVEAARSSSLPLVALAAVVFAPIAEEALFRGVLFRALDDRRPRGLAVVASALAFGLIHVEPLAIGITALFGAYAALVYARRGTLVAVIFMHATFNAFGLVAIVTTTS